MSAAAAMCAAVVPPADVGFGVGHTRETETKGIWVWGKPKTIKDGLGERMVRYICQTLSTAQLLPPHVLQLQPCLLKTCSGFQQIGTSHTQLTSTLF